MRPLAACALALALSAPALAAPHHSIPKRPAGAKTGSEFMKSIEGLDKNAEGFVKREEAALKELLAGNVPSFLREFVEVKLEAKGHKGSVWVSPDYLAIGSDDDFMRIPLNPITAQKVQDKYGTTFVTSKLSDDIQKQAKAKIAPISQTAWYRGTPGWSMMTNKFYEEHNTRVDAALKKLPGYQRGQLSSGLKKDIVLSILLKQKSKGQTGRWGQFGEQAVIIYGLHMLNGQAIQPESDAHENTYMDYGHGVRLVSQTMVVDGKEMKVADVLTNKQLAPLLLKPLHVLDYKFPPATRYPSEPCCAPFKGAVAKNDKGSGPKTAGKDGKDKGGKDGKDGKDGKGKGKQPEPAGQDDQASGPPPFTKPRAQLFDGEVADLYQDNEYGTKVTGATPLARAMSICVNNRGNGKPILKNPEGKDGNVLRRAAAIAAVWIKEGVINNGGVYNWEHSAEDIANAKLCGSKGYITGQCTSWVTYFSACALGCNGAGKPCKLPYNVIGPPVHKEHLTTWVPGKPIPNPNGKIPAQIIDDRPWRAAVPDPMPFDMYHLGRNGKGGSGLCHTVMYIGGLGLKVDGQPVHWIQMGGGGMSDRQSSAVSVIGARVGHPSCATSSGKVGASVLFSPNLSAFSGLGCYWNSSEKYPEVMYRLLDMTYPGLTAKLAKR